MKTETQFASSAMKRTSDWILSQEFPSDITIQVGERTFNLHKLPLASKCGYVRKHVSGANGSRVTHLEIAGMPGGAAAFELVVKFCYGVNFEITVDNVAMLRCAAEHLEMTEECKPGNLIGRAEAYLEEVALASLAGAVTALRRAEELLPASEKAQLVARCIDPAPTLPFNPPQPPPRTEIGQRSPCTPLVRLSLLDRFQDLICPLPIQNG